MTTQGKRLKQVRQRLDFSQDEMGKVLGMSKQFLSNIENDRKNLNNEKLLNLLNTYNVNINWLLNGKGEMFISDKDDDFDKKIEQKITEILKKHGLE